MTAAEPRADQSQKIDRGHLLFGAALVLIGLAFLSDNIGWWHVTLTPHHWPFILIFIGVVRMLWPRSRRAGADSPRPGVFLVMVGLWGLVSEFGWYGLEYGTSWPLLIIAAGINMVWRAFEEK